MAEIEPCPFCADPMQVRGTLLQHVEQGNCVIGKQAYDVTDLPRWNTRAAPPTGTPLTAEILAEAFDTVWNAAIGASQRQQSDIGVASIIAESFAAMSARLREIGGNHG
jgi:hypothetical protein